MASSVRHITIDAADAYTLGQFWSGVLERPLHDDDVPGDPEALLPLPDGPAMLFITVPDVKSGKNRWHVDITPEDRTRDDEVARLLEHGATVYEDHRRPDGKGWVTMRDIEGNEFCVERGPVDQASG